MRAKRLYRVMDEHLEQAPYFALGNIPLQILLFFLGLICMTDNILIWMIIPTLDAGIMLSLNVQRYIVGWHWFRSLLHPTVIFRTISSLKIG